VATSGVISIAVILLAVTVVRYPRPRGREIRYRRTAGSMSECRIDRTTAAAAPGHGNSNQYGTERGRANRSTGRPSVRAGGKYIRHQPNKEQDQDVKLEPATVGGTVDRLGYVVESVSPDRKNRRSAREPGLCLATSVEPVPAEGIGLCVRRTGGSRREPSGGSGDGDSRQRERPRECVRTRGLRGSSVSRTRGVSAGNTVGEPLCPRSGGYAR